MHMAEQQDVPSAAVVSPGRTVPAYARLATNALFLLLFALLAASSWQHFMRTGTLRSLGVLAVNTLFLVLFVLRRPAKDEASSPFVWALSLIGSALPLLMRPSEGAGFSLAGEALQVSGLAVLALALLSLRTSFAIVPANRGIRQGGLYGFVRHPIYLAELTVLLGVVLANPTAANIFLWLCECPLQCARVVAEERLLTRDPIYRAYRQRVRYRLIPGII
jgi:protein-S-isoprenylcysteine O-methyltransferase Ste14